ncbi:MAG: DUF1904 family protein [Bacilli bacterium]
MPHIHISNIKESVFKDVCIKIGDRLIKEQFINKDLLNFYHNPEKLFRLNEFRQEYVFVLVQWKPSVSRSQDQAFYIIRDELKKKGFDEVIVYFEDIKDDHYYHSF